VQLPVWYVDDVCVVTGVLARAPLRQHSDGDGAVELLLGRSPPLLSLALQSGFLLQKRLGGLWECC